MVRQIQFSLLATSRTSAIIVKELRELVRDPIYLGLAFIVPLTLMLLFGYGMSVDVKHLPLAFVDLDNSPNSRAYQDAFTHSDYFNLLAVKRDPAPAEGMMAKGNARLVIEIPAGFGRNLESNQPAEVSITIDGSYPSRAEIIQGYVTAINNLFNQKLLDEFITQHRLQGQFSSVSMAMSVWYNPSLESKNFIVPGMLVIILMLFPALLGALLIVREKEEGTIFNFYCSPAGRWEIIFGKAIPYISVAFIDYLILYAMSRWLFDVRFVGSFWLLSSGALLYSTCTIGIGLVISILTRSQLAAMLLTFLLTVTPAFNYSGFLAPVSSQDAIGQFAAHLIPATYFMDLVRGSYLKGQGLGFYQFDLLALGVYSLLVYLLAWWLFKKRLD